MAEPPPKSSKQSDTKASSLSEQLKDIVFYIDRSIQMKSVIESMTAAGCIIEPHTKHFKEDEDDINWLPFVGTRQWVVITKDEKIRYRPLERRAILEAKVKAIVISAEGLKSDEIAILVVSALPGIIRILNEHTPPFIAKVYKTGRVSMWADTVKLTGNLP